VIALFSAALTMRLAIHGSEVRVPDFTGVDIAQAMQRISDLGLNATVADHLSSQTIPAGNIAAQSPPPGSNVRHEWIVRLVVSLGPQKVSIPNVVGLSQRDATLTIREAHLDLCNIAVLPWPTAKPGTVIAQDPPEQNHGADRPRVSLLIAAE